VATPTVDSDPSLPSDVPPGTLRRLRAARAAEVAMATLLGHLGVLPADQRDEIVHPPIRNVVGLLVGEMRPAKSWLG